MLWAVLATVISAPATPVASTYDEAACTEAEKAHDEDVNCSEPEPVPAVLDCNDARVSLWLGDMIGSCDMPKPQLPGAIPVVHAPNPELRLCRDGHCGLDAVPLHATARSLDEVPPIVGTSVLAPPIFSATSSTLRPLLRRSQHGADRLERPPRSV
jgi:hypothetical protein